MVQAKTTTAKLVITYINKFLIFLSWHILKFVFFSVIGRGAAIGYRTKKIISVAVKSVSCAMCRAGHPPEDHDCRKNHSGTAKAMEPQGAVDLMVNNQEWKDAGVHLDVLIGDEDASTFARVQQQTSHEVKKWIDINHCKGEFTKKLYKLKGRFTFLSSGCIKYLKKCLSYAILQTSQWNSQLPSATLLSMSMVSTTNVETGARPKASLRITLKTCQKDGVGLVGLRTPGVKP